MSPINKKLHMLRFIQALALAALCIAPQTNALKALAQNAATRTLRVDYDFSGNNKEQRIALSELCSFNGWAGRRLHTDSLLLHGNGDITLRDAAT